MLRAHVPASLLAICLGACGAPVVFQGESTLPITGEPPAAAAPAVEPPRVEVRDNKIVIGEKIQFEYDKATIMEVSFGLLNEIASVIKNNPHIKKIQIEGHASSDGELRHNQRLSEARAASVLRYLVDRGGIGKQLLASKGFGIDRPIADNGTEAGREQNRRVEFNILEQEVTERRVEIDKDGKEKVVEEKKIEPTANQTTSSK